MRTFIQQHKQSGAVSLFVVIFAALLMTVVTVGFVQLMLKDQQQSTANDLSQSAYDSAQAGVEDAKRLLILDELCRNNAAAAGVNCATIASALTPAPGQFETGCDTLAKAGLVVENNNEAIIQQSTTDNSAKLDQAYTCVKIGVHTDTYKGQIGVNQSNIVPIAGVSAFDRVEVSWFSKEDISSTTDDPAITFPGENTGDISLPPVGSEWAFNTPALLRTQLMQTGTNFKLTDFDDQASSKSNANTLFLYPAQNGLDEKDFALDARRSITNAPQQAKCHPSLNDHEYACTTTLLLPAPIDGNVAQRNAFLRLSALYNGAHYSLRLKQGTEYVKFDRVQPEVDSTGRANDMFRRVKARVELKGDFTYPEAAVDIAGNLCKNFMITDAEEGFSGTTSCTP